MRQAAKQTKKKKAGKKNLKSNDFNFTSDF